MKLNYSQFWNELSEHQKVLSKIHLRNLFQYDPNRASEFSFQLGELLFDFSKHHLTKKTLQLLVRFAEEQNLPEKIQSMFRGDRINFTENRAVLHIALRNRSNNPIFVDGKDVMPEINSVLSKMQRFVEGVHNGIWRGFSGEKIIDIVNIGIGGSDLGPRLVCEALKPYRIPQLGIHFVSNVDGLELHNILQKVTPSRTIFLISSKSFTTTETMTNALTARNWFLQNGSGKEEDIAKHFIAISTNVEACKKFGIPEENMFIFWDWVGGRFSLWSSIGLSIALAIGWENFIQFLEGANLVDTHFRTVKLERNIPVIMGMLSFWYNNFWGYRGWAIVPYDSLLKRLPAYLQQLVMESNGKRIDEDDNEVDYQTSGIIFGGVGTDAQHSFFQFLHQGTQIVPVDFISACQPHHTYLDHHKILVVNMIAQSEALMRGKTESEVLSEMRNLGNKANLKLLPHKIFPGNRPSTVILLKKLTPKNLGILLAVYEHRVFTEGAVLRINSFDQWGVELGKELSKKLLTKIDVNYEDSEMSASSKKLMNYFKENLVD
ncbi:MAG: glucose-6-phosphate isomerase [Candidatus Kapaibacteriales bacterium]